MGPKRDQALEQAVLDRHQDDCRAHPEYADARTPPKEPIGTLGGSHLGARDLRPEVSRNVVIVRGAVSPDHVHLLLSAPPILSPAKAAQYIKGRSSRHLQAEFPELRKRYWGQHMWARGYFCATVGAVDEATIKAYIESQKWDEDDHGFKITAPTEP